MSPRADISDFHFDDYQPGMIFDCGSFSVDAPAIIEFARHYDPQTMHVDEESAKDGPYGGLIASGWHTGALTMQLVVEGFLSKSASMGSPGIDELRWIKPVRPGDTLSVTVEVLESLPSRSKPDRGIVRTRIETRRTGDELVMSMIALTMFRRRG